MTKTDRLVLMWILLVSGLILVCFAPSLSEMIYPPIPRPGGGYIIKEAELLQAVFVCRSLGFMAFVAGLAQRIAIAIIHSGANQPPSDPGH